MPHDSTTRPTSLPVRSALRDGLHGAMQWRLWLLWIGASLACALIAALPAWNWLAESLNHSVQAKAIANGEVVFSDWMRGFGNLLIVDHGGKYLSIYGNNEAVLKQSGDTVRGGDVIASVGNSGGNPESGLYFEIRYQGQPLDPLKWVNLK